MWSRVVPGCLKKGLVVKLSREDVAWLFKILRQVDFLEAYTTEELESLIDKMDKKTFDSNEIIIRQGSEGKFFFLIRRGQVTVMVQHEKEEKILASLTEGHYFGEISLLTGQPCAATVKTESKTEVFTLYPDDFRFILMRNPGLVKSMSRVLSQRRSELTSALGESLITGDDLLSKMRQFHQIEGDA